MFGLDGLELLVIIIVGFVLMKPKDVPVVMRKMREGLFQLKRMKSDFQYQVDEFIYSEELKSMRDEFEQSIEEVKTDIETHTQDIKTLTDDASQVAKP